LCKLTTKEARWKCFLKIIQDVIKALGEIKVLKNSAIVYENDRKEKVTITVDVNALDSANEDEVDKWLSAAEEKHGVSKNKKHSQSNENS
jgi:hypothetical protein